MEETHFLGLGTDFIIEQVVEVQRHFLVAVRSIATFSCCPLCSLRSERVHSQYQRTITDIPCSGCTVTLKLTVRRFFCRNNSCVRRIFTERLPELLLPHAQMTNRLREALCALSFATSAQAASRLAPRLGMKSSPSTLLRCQKTSSLPLPSSHTKIGIDDFAFRRGQTYGTIIVNLETHQIVDLLPDRSKETAKTWLCTHPEIEVISRDRASNYSDAAREGAPQALQIADRFHLIKNIRGKIKDVLDRNRSCLPLVKNSVPSSAPSSRENPLEKSGEVENDARPQEKEVDSTQVQVVNQLDKDPASPHPLTEASRRRQINRDKRYALYEKVKDLRQQGLSHYAIADVLGISRPTVRRFLEAEQFPERVERSKAKPKNYVVAPYLPFLKERWEAGCHNGRQLFREAMIRMIEDERVKAEALDALGVALIKAQQLERIEAIWAEAGSLPVEKRIGTLKEAMKALKATGKHEHMLRLVQYAWQQASTRSSAIILLPLAFELIFLKPEIGTAFYETFAWVDDFLKG